MIHAERDVAHAVASQPCGLRIGTTHKTHGPAIAGTQSAIQAIVATAVVAMVVVAKLCIVEPVIVAQHGIGPCVAQEVDIAQVDDVVVVAIDVVAIVVEIVER